MRFLHYISLTVIAFVGVACHRGSDVSSDARAVPAPGYVAIEGGRFVVGGEAWYPKMLNYKCFFGGLGDSLEVVPAPWYTGGDIRSHFDTIASWGFNAVRLCLDGDWSDGDTAAMHRATRRAVMQADSAGLRVMLLVHPPLDAFWMAYTAGLMRRLADVPALWAYDLMNEPLYFDPKPRRDKRQANKIVQTWRTMVRQNAPHQLFTLALAEPIEVFEWDPSMLAVDFVEMHTYHPLRVQSEMWWYANHCGKPWMVGETGLPADGDSVPYEAQAEFMRQTYRYAMACGACGYGWWEFQDCPDGVNFEARYTGLRDSAGRAKPAATLLRLVSAANSTDPRMPVNYYNMLAYGNVAVTGMVTDRGGRPIEGAVIRGWNEDWSVGINTYSRPDGTFRLVSNDVCTHFEIAAPGYDEAKFDRRLSYPSDMSLPDKEREYQQIPLLGWGDSISILPCVDDGRYAATGAIEADMGGIVLKKL